MITQIVNEETRSFWQRAKSAVIFEKEGLLGLKSPSGEIVLKPKYDQIEFCTDFVYAHYGTRHVFFYKTGSSSDCPDMENDYRFYEKGMLGLKNSDGSILLPAAYDEIIDWGNDCDVIYVRKGDEFHYYNHNLDKILTDVEDIAEDKYPLIPYNLGEDQNRDVLLCVEPIEKKESDRDCFAYGQWVRLSRIPYKSIRKIFTDCKVVEMPQKVLEHFEDEYTYIYSARICKANGEKPITTCLEKMKTLGCYNSSWEYMLKISTNSHTKINPHDLYNLVKHFEGNDLETRYLNCINLNIAIDIDESLSDGEVQVFQVHFFWDDMGLFLDDEFKMSTLPDGTVNDVKSSLEAFSQKDKEEHLDNAFWWIQFSEKRNWKATKQVLEYLKAQGCDDYSTLIQRNLDINYFCMEDNTCRMEV